MTDLSTNTTFALVDTRYAFATINLPTLNTAFGRSITVKDGYGNAYTSSITIQTDPADYFEDGSQVKTLTIPFSFQTFVAGSNAWYSLTEPYPSSLTVDSYLTVSTLHVRSSVSIFSSTFRITGSLTVSTLNTDRVVAQNSISTNLLQTSTLNTSSVTTAIVSTGQLIAPSIAPVQQLTFGTTSPSTLDTLLYWFDATSLTPNTQLISWSNLAPVNFQSTMNTVTSETAYVIPSSINSYKSVRLSSCLMVLSTPTTYEGSELTVMGVYTLTNSNSLPRTLVQIGESGLTDSNLSGCIPLYASSISGTGVFPNLNYGTMKTTPAFIQPFSTPTIFTSQWTLARSTFQYINGSVANFSSFPILNSYTVEPYFTYSTIYLGAKPNQTQGWIGNLGELLVFNAGLPTSQRESMEGYLSKKWAVPLTPNHPYA